MNTPTRLATLGATLLLAGSALAADIKVPDDFATIQDALDAAGTGDTVVVRQGVYRENPTITTDGVRLLGQGAVIDGQYRGPCLFVLADDVTLEGFELLHGGDALGVDDTLSYAGDGATIRRNRLSSGAGTGIHVAGDDAVIGLNTIEACAGEAIRCVGASTSGESTIERNRISACGAGIFGDVGRFDVLGNTLSSIAGAGIELTPSVNLLETEEEARVERNTVEFVAGAGIQVTAGSGGQVTVRSNRLGRVQGIGVDVTGSGPTNVNVVRNRVVASGGAGVRIVVAGGTFFGGWNTVVGAGGDALDGSAGSDGGKLEKNVVRDAGGHGIATTGDGVIVRQNRITGTVGHGVFHTGDTASLRQNRVRGAALDGVRHVGDDGTITRNVVTRAGRDGLLVSGSDNTIERNVSTSNGGDGIDLEELDVALDNTDNEILDNTCVGNAHEGIDNTGLNTVIEGNTVANNGGALGPEIAGAGNDVDGDDVADGTVASFQDNKLPPAKGDKDPGGPTTAQRLDLGVPVP